MAYLKKQRVGERTYFYIVRVVPKGYREETLESLGPDPARVERALKYWRCRLPRDNKRLVVPAVSEPLADESGHRPHQPGGHPIRRAGPPAARVASDDSGVRSLGG
jgi:hypothetical protein